MIEWLAEEAPLILSLTPMANGCQVTSCIHDVDDIATHSHGILESSLQAHKWNLWIVSSFAPMIFPWSEKASAKIPGTRPKQTIGR